MTGLDVLVIESRRGVGKHHAEALRAAGHRVHWCHDEGSDDFPCRAITDGDTCPIDQGIDVALVVRQGVHARPTPGEQGVSCAIRAGVPLVADGPTVLDPFADYLTLRVTGKVNTAVEGAAARSNEQLEAAIRTGVAPTLDRVGVDVNDLGCTFTRTGTRLRVELAVPDAAASVEQALAVRVIDLLRDQRQHHEQIDVVFQVDGAS